MDPFRRDKREELVVKKWAHVEAHAKIYHKHTTTGSAAWADKYTDSTQEERMTRHMIYNEGPTLQ